MPAELQAGNCHAGIFSRHFFSLGDCSMAAGAGLNWLIGALLIGVYTVYADCHFADES
jgi:hypothetical protein